MKTGRQFGIDNTARKALFRNMVTSLMEHGRVRTTEAKAKELRRIADRVITFAKRVPNADLAGLEGAELAAAKAKRVHAIRLARRYVENRDVLNKVFTEYSDRYALRPGGYTRIYKLSRRPGDNAAMALVELVTEPWPPQADATSAEGQSSDDATAPE
jgi:large subunit ribosomal protein L17